MPFIVDDPGHVAEHNRIAQALPPGFVPASTDSPALTGTPTAPTPPVGDSSGNIATTEFTQSAIATTTSPPVRFLSVMKNETRDTSILVVSDSTGVTTDRWIYRFAVLFAAAWPDWTVNFAWWDDTAGAYDAATTLQTGTGPRTLTFYAAAVSGTGTTDWQSARAPASIYALSPDIVMISMGHNEQVLTPDVWHSRYVSLSESIAAGLPEADLILIGQNPETANTYQQQRNELYRLIAARRGYGFIDVQQAWLDSGNIAALNVDGVHPTSAGSALWAQTVMTAFSWREGRSPRVQKQSALLDAGVNILQNPMFTISSGVLTNWSMSNCTAAVDTTNYESATINGVSGSATSTAVKLTATAAGALIAQYVPTNLVKGRWVTVALRILVPAGAPATVGRLGIADSTGSSLNAADMQPSGGFRWMVCSRFIPKTATYGRVVFYVDSGSTLGNVTVDRATLVIGKFPHDLSY